MDNLSEAPGCGRQDGVRRHSYRQWSYKLLRAPPAARTNENDTRETRRGHRREGCAPRRLPLPRTAPRRERALVAEKNEGEPKPNDSGSMFGNAQMARVCVCIVAKASSGSGGGTCDTTGPEALCDNPWHLTWWANKLGSSRMRLSKPSFESELKQMQSRPYLRLQCRRAITLSRAAVLSSWAACSQTGRAGSSRNVACIAHVPLWIDGSSPREC